MKRDSVQARLRNLTHDKSLSPSARERLRRNLDMEIKAFLKEKHIRRRRSLSRRLVTTMSIVAPLLFLLIGYQLWNKVLTNTSTNNQHVSPMSPTELVTPSTMPTGVTNVPTVTLIYTDHSHYEYTLDYTAKSGGTRFRIQEGSVLPNTIYATQQDTWKIRSVSVEVFKQEQSTIYALFTYAGRHYTVIATGAKLSDVKTVATSLVDSAIKRG